MTCNDKAELVEDTKIMFGAQHTGDNEDEDEEDDPHKDLLASQLIKVKSLFQNLVISSRNSKYLPQQRTYFH